MTKPTSKNLNAILEGEVTETKSISGGGCVTSRKLNNIMEDWGSSDWSACVTSMDRYMENIGVTPENIQSAAEDAAEFYYEDMGYERPEDAVDTIIRMYLNRKGWADFFASKNDDHLQEGEKKPKLDRHGRIKVPHWGSDDEQEEGTVKAQLRKMPPKKKVNEALRTAYPYRYLVRETKNSKWVQLSRAMTRDEIIQQIQLKTRYSDVRLGTATKNDKGNYEYPVMLGGRRASRHKVVGIGTLGGPAGQ